MRSAALLLLATLTAASARAEAVPVIFDTDIGNDVDDALALAMLHAFETRGECRLIAVTVTKDNPASAGYISAVNTFYGRGSIPIGVVKNSRITPEASPMLDIPLARKNPDGSPVYPHALRSGSEAPDAVQVLRRALEAEADHSVVVIQVGFSTNLARLLDSGARELVERKVKLLAIMGGNYISSKPEYNIQQDVSSAQKVLRDWPTPIVASGFEIGESIVFPARNIERDFAYAPNHPVADAYRAFEKMPYDRPTWDLTAVLYAVRPEGGYFTLSPPGTITANARGSTSFAASEGGRHRYLKTDATQRVRALEAMTLLASQPPR